MTEDGRRWLQVPCVARAIESVDLIKNSKDFSARIGEQVMSAR